MRYAGRSAPRGATAKSQNMWNWAVNAPGGRRYALSPRTGTSGRSAKSRVPHAAQLSLRLTESANEVVAPREGVVSAVAVEAGAAVSAGQLLLEIGEDGAAG